MKNVLILGAYGFIGRCLANELSKKVNVIGYDKESVSVTTRHIFPCLHGDFLADTRLAGKFREILNTHEIDTVYHLISTTVPAAGTKYMAQEIEDNVVSSVKLLESMRNTGVKRVIFASSGGTVYGESKGRPHPCSDGTFPICSHGIQKTTIEHYLQLYDRLGIVKCLIARISNPYGCMPLQNRKQGVIPILLSKLVAGEPIAIFGNTVRDYIYIDDTIDALIRLGYYDKDKRVFNIGTGKSTRLHDLVAMCEKTANRKFSAIEFQDIRECDVVENILDISETITELDWIPNILLEEGIKLTFQGISDK